MNPQIDFLALYRELGIDPGCSPEAFKHAYRRRVSELHPDREGSAGEEALKLLNLGYAAALEFFHVHGRFPGAPARSTRDRAVPAAQPHPAASVHVLHPVLEGGVDHGIRSVGGRKAGLRPGRWLSIVLVALVVVVLGAQMAGREDGAEVPEADAWSPRRANAWSAAHPAAVIGVGMPARDVLDAFGAPTDTAEDGRLWHYGPSWVRMSCREVVDWYSSPLKPLGASPMHPGSPGEENERAATCLELDPSALR